jgi:large repetitive protein
VKSRKSGFFGFGKRSGRNSGNGSKRPVIRQGIIETLEKREMLSADWNPLIAAGTGRFASPSARTNTIQMIQAFADGQGMPGVAGGGPEGSASTSVLSVPEVEPNNARLQAQHLPLGFQTNQFTGVNVNGTNTNTDVDWFSFDLRGGDILDISVNRTLNGPPPLMTLYDNSGVELASTLGSFPPIFPAASPLTGSETAPSAAASIHYIMPTEGRYFFRLSDVGSTYSAALRVYRPVLESQAANTQQILWLDFDGEIISRNTFGLGPGSVNLLGIQEFLPDLGLNPNDENLLIDEILARVTDKFDEVAQQANNPNFGIQIMNSRDHGDMWGLPNVSRIIVGGTLDEDPIFSQLLGIAEAIDPGNFETELSALTVVPSMLSYLDIVPTSSSATRLQLTAELLANTTVHEAGHFFGLWHQDELNNVFGMMDTVVDPFVDAGTGPDGIFGTPDDTPLQFISDRFSGTAAGPFQRGGRNDNINWLGWALATGTQGGSVLGTVYKTR